MRTGTRENQKIKTRKTDDRKSEKKLEKTPDNIYTSVPKQPSCPCPCCVGLNIELLVEVKVLGWYVDIIEDEFLIGKETDYEVEIEKEKMIKVNFKNKDLGKWKNNEVKITIEATAYFDKEVPDKCCISGEGAFQGTAKIIYGKETDRTAVPKSFASNPKALLKFPLGKCTGKLCCRVAFKPYHLKGDFSFPAVPRIILDGWVFTQVSSYLRN